MTKPKFVITGKLKNHTRVDMINKIQKCGGECEPRITNGTNYLIVGDTGIHGITNKMRAARDNGVNVLSEDVFVNYTIKDLKEFIKGLKDINQILMAFDG